MKKASGGFFDAAAADRGTSESLLGQEHQFRMLNLDPIRDAAAIPVVHSLDATRGFVIAEKLCDLCWATKPIDQFCVFHDPDLNTMLNTESTRRESTFCLACAQSGMAKRKDDDAHPSMMRLLECAKKATAGTSRPVTDWTSLKAYWGPDSDGRFSNWKRTRGLSKEGALEAQEMFGCSANWLLTGEGQERHASTAPPPPVPPDFSDRRLASHSEWSVLQDLDAIPPTQREKIVAEIRELAANYREHAMLLIEQMKRARIKK